jgi:hypothetical protein
LEHHLALPNSFPFNTTFVDVLVAAGDIPSWKIIYREKEDSRNQRKTIE